jgi:hypothetical protein
MSFRVIKRSLIRLYMLINLHLEQDLSLSLGMIKTKKEGYKVASNFIAFFFSAVILLLFLNIPIIPIGAVLKVLNATTPSKKLLFLLYRLVLTNR